MRSKKEKSKVIIGTDCNSYFQKGSIPNCVIESPVKLTPKELEDFKKSWEKSYSGLNYGQSPVVEAFKPSDIPGLVLWLKADDFVKSEPLRKPYFRFIRPEVAE